MTAFGGGGGSEDDKSNALGSIADKADDGRWSTAGVDVTRPQVCGPLLGCVLNSQNLLES